MPTTKSAPRDLTDEEYRRECILRNPAFIKEKEVFLNRWKSEPDLFAEAIVGARKATRGRGKDAILEQQRKQGRFLHELIELCQRWPSIAPGDITGVEPAVAGPKVRVAFNSRSAWPRDGSLLLSVDPTTTGDEIKQQWQNIKKQLGLTSHRQRRGERVLKLRVYDLYRSMSQSKGKRLANFADIARIVKKPRSTVTDLYDSVYKDIHGIKPKSVRRLAPNFDTGVHLSTCPSCQTGKMCSLAEDGLKAELRRVRT